MKIAFLFLILTKHNQYDIWVKYLDSMPNNSYGIYCHPKDPLAVMQPLLRQSIIKNLAETRRRFILQAGVNLLDAAFHNDKDLTHFCLITESCIPIKNCTFLEKFINKVGGSNGASIIDWWPVKMNDIVNRYVETVSKTGIQYPKNKFAKHSSYFILNREDTEFILKTQNTDFYKVFLEMPFGEEHFLSLLKLREKGVAPVKHMVTFANWEYRNDIRDENKKIYWEQYDRFKAIKDKEKWSPQKQEAFEKYLNMLNENYHESASHPQIYVSVSNKDIKKFIELDVPFARKFADISNIGKFWNVVIDQ